MEKFITKEELAKAEMELFSKTYPCYMLITLFVLDSITLTKISVTPYMYETELINGEWLLKTKDN